MKCRILIMAALCAALAFGTSTARAEDAAKPAGVKIGVVNLQRVLNESDFGKQAKSSIEEIYKQKGALIESKASEKEKLTKDLEKQGMALSDDERKKRIDELDSLDSELKHMISDAETYMQKLDRQKKEEFVKVIDKIVGNYGKGEGYTMIVPSDAVIYSQDGMDITDKIMALFNEAYKNKLASDKAGEGKPAAGDKPKKGK